MANFGGKVMRNCYAIGLVCRFHEASDPNGIRTHFRNFVMLRKSTTNMR